MKIIITEMLHHYFDERANFSLQNNYILNFYDLQVIIVNMYQLDKSLEKSIKT